MNKWLSFRISTVYCFLESHRECLRRFNFARIPENEREEACLSFQCRLISIFVGQSASDSIDSSKQLSDRTTVKHTIIRVKRHAFRRKYSFKEANRRKHPTCKVSYEFNGIRDFVHPRAAKT